MEQIRRGIFETNSSSTHSITMCSDSDYEKWKKGELIYDCDDEVLVEVNDEIKKSIEDGEKDFLTYDAFFNCLFDYNTYHDQFTTANGETVHSFGYYGYEG